MRCIGLLVVFYAYLVEAEELNVAYNIVKSSLAYYGSRSAILVTGGNSQQQNLRDEFNFISLQKLMSSNHFYFTSLTTLSVLSKTLKKKREGMKETVVILEFDKKLNHLLEKETNQTDMASYKWMLTTPNLIPEDINKLMIPLNSEFIIAHGNAEKGYNLSEMYHPQPNQKLTKAIGQYNVGEPFLLKDIFERRKNLEGALIKVLSSNKDNCIQISFATGLATVAWCIHQKVWGLMEEMLNATTEVVVVPNLTPDAILNSEAELTFRSAPLNVVDMNTRSYIWPIFGTKVEAVTSYIEQKVEWRTYLLPFSKDMWTVILIWIIICDLLLACVEFVMERNKKRNSFLRHYNEFSFTTTFIFCSQGFLGPSKFASNYIIFVMMFIVPGVIFPGYSAILTSFLTVQLYKTPFENLEELSRLKEYKVGWHSSFAFENMFNLKDKDVINQNLLKNNILPKEKLPTTDIEGINRICNEKFVYLTTRDTVLALKPKCRYFKLKQHFKIIFTSMETKKNSQFKYLFDRCERILDYSGISYRVAYQVVLKYIKYNNLVIDSGQVRPIRIENIVLPFAVLLLGAACSVFFLTLEVVYYKIKNVKKHRPLIQQTLHGDRLFEINTTSNKHFRKVLL